MTPERQTERTGKIKHKLGKTAFIFGNLSLAWATITSACAGQKGESPESFQTATPKVSLQTPIPTETLTATPTPEIIAEKETEQEPKQVFTTENLNVRGSPGLNFPILETQQRNTLGEVMEGPIESDGYFWWNIKYEDGTQGWSAQDWLKFGTWPTIQDCDFSKPATLRETQEFGIFGDDTFDTLACGYVKFRVVEDLEAGERRTIPYLAIVDYRDEGFIKAIDEGITTGNGVNKKGPRYYEFNLGCLKDGKIVGIEYEGEKPYMDQETQQAILESSPEKIVFLKLSFGPHLGRGCDCCNLAHQIRLY